MKPKPKEKSHSFISNVIYILKDIGRHKPMLIAALAASSVCDAAAALAALYLPKTAIGLVENVAAPTQALLTLGLFFAFLGLINAIGGYASSTVDNSYFDLRMMYMRRIVSKSMHQNYGRLESAEGQSCYWKARDVVLNGTLSAMINNIILFLVNLLNFASFSFVISKLNPLIVVFLGAMSAVTFSFMQRGSRIWESVRSDRAKNSGQRFTLTEECCTAAGGKDIRLYGLGELFVRKIKELNDINVKLYNKQRSGYIQEHYVTILLNFIRDAAAYAYLIYRTVGGGISAGDFVLYFGAISGLSSWIGNITWRIDVLRRNYFDVNYFREFMEYEDPAIENPQKIPEGRSDIEFKNVSFSYDGKTDVLKDFSLKINPGEHIALIGVNGAGKSTAVKLLCGFYAPTKGSVCIGDAEVSKVLPEERFQKIAAVFQDICILPHTVAENISMKEADLTDITRAKECLSAADIDFLSSMVNSPMTKSVIDDGIDLSGGEAQKLMMARALYKSAPILILDEPTAALDPIAESETYERFHTLLKDKTAIYISHRLAGTRFCDKIVFLDGGKAAEVGTHRELMELNGGYAKMFEMQSQYYKEGRCEEDEKHI